MNIFTIKCHPAAEIFPMMDEESLAALAADIGEHGLLVPIVIATVEGTTVLVDGRNRRAACKAAGIKKPATVDLDGGDPVAYIYSANIHRRNLTKGQRAMGAAKLYPEPAKGGRGRKSSVSEGFSDNYLSSARTVLRYAPDLVDGVISASTSLDIAYAEARSRKSAAATEASRMAELRKVSSGLADKVEEGDMEVDDALRCAKLDDRYVSRVTSGKLSIDEAEHLAERDEREHQEAIQRQVIALLAFLNGLVDASYMHKNPQRDEVLGHLTDPDRKTFLKFEKRYN